MILYVDLDLQTWPRYGRVESTCQISRSCQRSHSRPITLHGRWSI